jgi:hypothetical protein
MSLLKSLESKSESLNSIRAEKRPREADNISQVSSSINAFPRTSPLSSIPTFPMARKLREILSGIRESILGNTIIAANEQEYDLLEIEVRLGMLTQGNRRWNSLVTSCDEETRDAKVVVADHALHKVLNCIPSFICFFASLNMLL